MHFSNPRFDDTRHRRPGGSVPEAPVRDVRESRGARLNGLARGFQVQRRPDPTGPSDPIGEATTSRVPAPRKLTHQLHGGWRRRRDALTGIGIPRSEAGARTRRAQMTRGARAKMPTRFGLRRRPIAGRRQNEQDQCDQELDVFAIRALHAPSTTGEKRTASPTDPRVGTDQGFARAEGDLHQRRRKYPPGSANPSTGILVAPAPLQPRLPTRTSCAPSRV